MQYRNMRAPIDKGSLCVYGSSSIEIPADMAMLCTGIITENINLEEAIQGNNKAYSNLLDSLNNYGISSEDIHQNSMSIDRNYDYDTNSLKSYTISNAISINITDFSKLNDIYSLLIKNGVNDNIKISFILSNPEVSYNKALKKASQAAISKASFLAKNFGLKYNPTPYKVREISSYLYSITYPSYDGCSYPFDLPPGLVKVSAEIESCFLTYQYQ